MSAPDTVAPWPLIGRDRELARFTAAWAARRCHGVVVCGPAGIGKSRLAEECLALAVRDGLGGGRATASVAAAAVPLGAIAHLPDLPSAFAAYEKLRRERVESIAATAAKTNSQKSGGPVARTLIRLLAPVAMKTFLTPEKMFGPVHRYSIEWDAKAA